MDITHPNPPLFLGILVTIFTIHLKIKLSLEYWKRLALTILVLLKANFQNETCR